MNYYKSYIKVANIIRLTTLSASVVDTLKTKDPGAALKSMLDVYGSCWKTGALRLRSTLMVTRAGDTEVFSGVPMSRANTRN